MNEARDSAWPAGQVGALLEASYDQALAEWGRSVQRSRPFGLLDPTTRRGTWLELHRRSARQQ